MSREFFNRSARGYVDIMLRKAQALKLLGQHLTDAYTAMQKPETAPGVPPQQVPSEYDTKLTQAAGVIDTFSAAVPVMETLDYTTLVQQVPPLTLSPGFDATLFTDLIGYSYSDATPALHFAKQATRYAGAYLWHQLFDKMREDDSWQVARIAVAVFFDIKRIGLNARVVATVNDIVAQAQQFDGADPIYAQWGAYAPTFPSDDGWLPNDPFGGGFRSVLVSLNYADKQIMQGANDARKRLPDPPQSPPQYNQAVFTRISGEPGTVPPRHPDWPVGR